MPIRPDSSFGRRNHPDEDLERVHEEKFGIRPEDLGIPLSEQGLPVNPRRRIEEIDRGTFPPKEPNTSGEGRV